MNRFIGLIIMVVAVAALAGAAIGWRFPFLGQRQSSNQLETSQDGTQGQPATNRARTLRANQPTTQAQNNNQTTAQAPDATVNPEATNTQQEQSDTNEPVSALW